MADIVRRQHRIAPEDVALQYSWKRPGDAAVRRKAPARLTKIRCNAVELPPADCHLVSVCRIHRNRWFVGCVAGNVVSVLVNIDLITGEGAVLRDHGIRAPVPPDEHRRIALPFEWLSKKR